MRLLEAMRMPSKKELEEAKREQEQARKKASAATDRFVDVFEQVAIVIRDRKRKNAKRSD